MCSALRDDVVGVDPFPEHREHLGERIGGEHLVAELRQHLGQLAGAGAELEDHRAAVPGHPGDGLVGVRRAGSVVGVGHRAERPFRGWASARSSCARSYPIAFAPCPTHRPIPPAIRSPGSSGLEGVPSAFAATRDGIDAMLRDRGLRRTVPEQTAESLLRGAHATAVLEGSGSSLEEVRAGTGDELAASAVRVSTELLSLVPVIGRSPLQAFAAAARARRRRRPAWLRRSGRPAAVALAGPAGDLRAGADGGGAGARRSRDGRALRVPQRDRGPRSRAAGAGRAGSRPGLARRTRGGAPGPARGVRVEPARLPRRWPTQDCTRGCCTPPRRRRRAPRRARCCPEPDR